MSLGLRPRRDAWIVKPAVSPPVVSIFSEGTEDVSAVARSVAPVFVKAAAPTTWIGAALSSALTPIVRVPVTTTSCTGAPLASWAKAGACNRDRERDRARAEKQCLHVLSP